jgi:hypothetical protein
VSTEWDVCNTAEVGIFSELVFTGAPWNSVIKIWWNTAELGEKYYTEFWKYSTTCK